MTGRLDSLLGLGSGDDDESATDHGAGPASSGVDTPIASASTEGGARADLGLTWLHPASITPNRFQPREHFDETELDSLAASIAAVGVLQPLLVRRIDEHRYELVAGERRWRAAQRAGLYEVPALVRTGDDQGALEQAVVENLHRQDLSAVEEAAAYRQLIEEFGLTQDAVAQRVGKSRSAVANTLRLLQLGPEVQRLITVGQLSAGHARALLALDDAREQRSLALRIVADELSVRQAEEAVRRQRAAAGGGNRASSSDGHGSAAVREIEALLSERLSTRVTVSTSGSRGRLVVEFADLDDLDRIYRELS